MFTAGLSFVKIVDIANVQYLMMQLHSEKFPDKFRKKLSGSRDSYVPVCSVFTARPSFDQTDENLNNYIPEQEL